MVAATENWAEHEVSWRELRNSSPKQCEFMDCLTLQGDFAPGGSKFMNTRTPMCLIGGAGEVGKSRCIRDTAFEILLRYRELGFPNRTVAIMCDTMPNLRRIHIKKLREDFGDAIDIRQSQEVGLRARLIGSDYEDLGQVLLLHAAQAHQTASQKGAEIDSLLVDELTSFTIEQFGEMMYQRRSSARLPFVSFGAGTNPDGIGHYWVKSLFVPEFQDLSGFDKRIQEMKGAIHFIPGVRSDNPEYEWNKESMDAAIAFLPNPDIRRARDTGDWNAYGGGRFGYFNKLIHGFTWPDFLAAQGEMVVQSPVSNAQEAYRLLANADMFGWEIWASFDYGTDPEGGSCLLFHVMDHESRVWTFGEWMRGGLTLPEQAAAMKPLLARFPLRRLLVDPALEAKVVESKSGLSRLALFYAEGIKKSVCGVQMTVAENARVPGWGSIDYLFARIPDPPGKIRPKGFIHSSECPYLVASFHKAPRSARDPEDIDARFTQDHGLDSLRYGWHSRFPNRPEFVKPPQYGSMLWMKQQEEAREQAAANQWR
jgi:hypothetical protein